jgi:hypothetical protein
MSVSICMSVFSFASGSDDSDIWEFPAGMDRVKNCNFATFRIVAAEFYAFRVRQFSTNKRCVKYITVSNKVPVPGNLVNSGD